MKFFFRIVIIQEAEYIKFLDCKIPLYAIHKNSHPSMMISVLVDHQKHLHIQTIVVSGDQILNPLNCVIWGFRNSEPFVVFFGGSEILNPSLCSLGDQKF